jgi:hypothetical protein
MVGAAEGLGGKLIRTVSFFEFFPRASSSSSGPNAMAVLFGGRGGGLFPEFWVGGFESLFCIKIQTNFVQKAHGFPSQSMCINAIFHSSLLYSAKQDQLLCFTCLPQLLPTLDGPGGGGNL